MLRTIVISFLFATALFAQSGGQPINIPIQNPSFEQPPVRHQFKPDPCGPWVSGEVPGWTITYLQAGAGAGIFQPANVAIPNYCEIPQPMPDGVTVAYLGGASISQDLGTFSGTGIYTLKFYVGNRFYYYPALYSASLTITDAVDARTCSVSGYALGDFVEIPLVCPRENPKQVDLKLTLTGDGNFELLLDYVSLTFMPIS